MDTRQATATRFESTRLMAAAPAFIVSLTVTETFFKWHSFSLEFIGFAVLFGALYSAQNLVVGALKKRS